MYTTEPSRMHACSVSWPFLFEMNMKQILWRFLARIQREGEWGDDVEIEADARA